MLSATRRRAAVNRDPTGEFISLWRNRVNKHPVINTLVVRGTHGIDATQC